MLTGVWLRSALPLMIVGACYAPSIAPGAPCDPALDNCPTGQECLPGGTGFVCGGGGAVDAATDATDAVTLDAVDGPPGDGDGDGVADAMDNCPQVGNPTQHDEDTDQLGDPCDPCPVSSSTLDGDSDGVGDDCDPRPTVAGDTIVLFEGFGGTLPAGWVGTSTAGTPWSIADDELRVELSTNAIAAMRTNLAGTAHMTAATSVVADQMFGTDAAVGIVNPHGPTVGAGGVLCSLYQPAAGARFLSLYELTPGLTIDNHAFAFLDDVPYVLVSERTDNSHVCSSFPGPASAPAGTAVTSVPSPVIGLRSDGTRARYQWLLVVQSP